MDLLDAREHAIRKDAKRLLRRMAGRYAEISNRAGVSAVGQFADGCDSVIAIIPIAKLQ